MLNKVINVLIVEDCEADSWLIERKLSSNGYHPTVKRVETSEEVRFELRHNHWDIIISDHQLPQLNAQAVLDLVRDANADTPVIIVSGTITDDVAVAAMGVGARDYISKNNLSRLIPAIERELRGSATRQAMKKAQALIKRYDTYDSVTGLTNREELQRRLSLLLRNDGLPRHHALLFVDIDHFRIIHDRFGNLASDELLRQVGHRIRNVLTEPCTLARFGGDEYAALLPDCDLSIAESVAENVLTEIKSLRFTHNEKTLSVSASIGVVQFRSSDSTSVDDILTSAELACHAAKERGRCRLYAYRSDDPWIVQRQSDLHWIAQISTALEENRFELHRQRIVPLNAPNPGEHYAEFLLRLRSPCGSQILPGNFLPAAERFKLMKQIDQWVVAHVFSQLAQRRQLREEQSEQLVFINLSADTLGDDRFFSFVREQAQTHEIDPTCVCFEITESALVANLAAILPFLYGLKNEGFRLALDDFGTGLSSFSNLKALPIDFLKVDGHFVRNMLDDRMDAAIVEAINHIAHVAGLVTIAEFAESKAVVERLRVMGVDFAQGFALD